MKILLIAGVVCSIFLMSVYSQQASAISHIGIDLSQTCLTMHKNNMSTICPSYEDIVTLFPDTSNKLISGDFGYSEGIYQRQHTKFKHHFNFYDYWASDVRWIDPPGDTREKIKLITITSTDFEYKIPFQTITEGSLQTGKSRYVSNNCDQAIITAQNWVFLLGDTLNYLAKNCQKSATNFDEIRIKTWETVNHDITTSAKYQLEQWQKDAIERCGKKICRHEETKFNPEGAR